MPIGLKHADKALASLALTLEDAGILFARHGISRLANQTGLDVIPVPVWNSVRPASRSVAVCFGKGMTDQEAQISALMESMESACAESRERLIVRRESLESMRLSRARMGDLHNIPQCRMEILPPNLPIDWVKGKCLSTGEVIYAPFDIVGLDYVSPQDQVSAAFHMTSIGLAAGLTWDDATVHALLEVIENDAASVLETLPALRLALPTGCCPPHICARLDQALSWFHDCGISPVFRHVSEEFGLSVVMCEIPRFGDQINSTNDVSVGFACRGNVADAALSALLEAAQTRMTLIAGAREDLRDHHYQVLEDQEVASPPLKPAPFFKSGKVEAVAKPSLADILSRLECSGITGVHVFELSEANSPICVVRVLVEGLNAAGGAARTSFSPRDISAILRISEGLV